MDATLFNKVNIAVNQHLSNVFGWYKEKTQEIESATSITIESIGTEYTGA